MGPISQETLIQLLKSGEIESHDQLWTKGWSTWKKVADVPGLLSPASLEQADSQQMGGGGQRTFSASSTTFEREGHDREEALGHVPVEVPREEPLEEWGDVAEEGPYPSDYNERGYFTFQGRANRAKYFRQIIVPAFAAAFFNVMASESRDPDTAFFGAIGLIASGIIMMFPACRRLHDLNLSGWLQLIGFIPVVNIIFGLVVLFVKGTTGPNEYGPDPLGRE